MSRRLKSFKFTGKFSVPKSQKGNPIRKSKECFLVELVKRYLNVSNLVLF